MLNGLVLGVCFLVSIGLFRLGKTATSWIWFGLFTLFQCADALLTMVDLYAGGEIPILLGIRQFLLGVSFLCLIEFVRKGLPLKIRFGIWIYLPLILVAEAADYFGFALWGVVIGVPALVGAVWFFWKKRLVEPVLKAYFRLVAFALAISVGFAVLFFLASFLGKMGMGISRSLNDFVFKWFEQGRAICAFMVAIALWKMGWSHYARIYQPEVLRYTAICERVAIGLLALLLMASWFGALWVENWQLKFLHADVFQRDREVLNAKTEMRTFLRLHLPEREWKERVALSRFPVLVLTISASFVLVGVTAFWMRLRMFSFSQQLQLKRIQRQETAISRLSSSSALANGRFDEAVREVAQLTAEALEVDLVGIWMADEKWNTLTCATLYSSSMESGIRCLPLHKSDHSTLFDQISNGNAIEFTDDQPSPLLTGGEMKSLPIRSVNSLVYVPFIFEKYVAGCIAIQQTNSDRVWMNDERQFWGDMTRAIITVLSNKRRLDAEEALAESERQFRGFVESLPQPAFETDLTGTFTMINQAACDIGGYEKDEVINKMNMFDFCHPSIHAQIRENIRMLMQGQSIPGFECPINKRDGSLYYGLIYTDIYFRREGKTSGFRGIAIDITKRKQTEEALRESERQLTQIINFLPDATMVINKDKQIIYWNKAIEIMSGIPSEYMQGRTDYSIPFYGVKRPILIDLISEMDTRIESKYFHIHRDGDNLVGESIVSLPGKGTIVIWGVARALYDTEGRFVGAIESIRDVTARRKAEEQLKQANEQLGQNNESLVKLLREQEVNIDLAKEVLTLINSKPRRHIPLAGPLELCVTSHFIPCHVAGGDHYFVRTLSSKNAESARTIVSLKDQSGHEVGCILRSIVTDLIHNALLQGKNEESLSASFTRLNNLVSVSSLFGEGLFFTAVNVEIDHNTLEMHFLSAGHPPFLLIRGGQVRLLPEPHGLGSNLPVGLFANRDFTMGSIHLQEKDQILFYTDGFLEIPRWTGKPQMTSESLAEAIQKIVSQNPNRPVSWVVSEFMRSIVPIEDKNHPVTHTDDVAILTVEVECRERCFETVLKPESSEQLSTMIKELAEVLQKEWEQFYIKNGEYKLRLTLEESLINAWRHGNKCDPSKTITIRRRYGNDAIIEVTDEGQGFVFADVNDPCSFENRTKSSGRGLFVIHLVSDDVRWENGGRTIIICFQNQSYPGAENIKSGKNAREFPLDLWGREENSNHS